MKRIRFLLKQTDKVSVNSYFRYIERYCNGNVTPVGGPF
jgi:hypothetical protein